MPSNSLVGKAADEECSVIRGAVEPLGRKECFVLSWPVRGFYLIYIKTLLLSIFTFAPISPSLCTTLFKCLVGSLIES